VSIYEERQLERVLERHAIDLVQAPVSLLDQRLARRGWLDRLKARGIEVHVRSLFLQGVLLADPGTLPARFEAFRDHLRRCHRRTRERGLSQLQAALAYVASLDACDVAIVGADSASQLREVLLELESLPAAGGLDWSSYALDAADLVDPRRWS
jgi:aryl-alcohol dehydrogenase-like predicted oxidoreductase